MPWGLGGERPAADAAAAGRVLSSWCGGALQVLMHVGLEALARINEAVK